MEIKWIEYKGKKILYSDYRGAKNDEDMLSILHKEAEILKQTDGPILELGNNEGTYTGEKYVKEGNRIGKELRKGKVSRIAVVGVTGIKTVLFKAYLRFTGQQGMKLFNTEEEAKEWLVS